MWTVRLLLVPGAQHGFTAAESRPHSQILQRFEADRA
jgi:hypothetical protein